MTQTPPTPELIDKFITFVKGRGWDLDIYHIADSLSKIWVKTPSFYDGFKLQWKKR